MKLIVYDLDGTLIDSRRDLAEAVNFMRRSYGAEPLSVDKVTSYLGDGMMKLTACCTEDFPVDAEEAFQRVAGYYREHYLVYTVLYPGVAECLKYFHEAGVRQVIFSNKRNEFCRRILAGLGVDAYLDEIVGDGLYPLKPAPDGLDAMRKKYDVPLENCWMIGDNWTDLAAGRAAGFRRVFARYGFGFPQEEEKQYQIENIGELIPLISGE